MKNQIKVNSIGSVHFEKGRHCIKVKKEFRKGMKNINGFTHLQIIWWGNLFDQPEHRDQLIAKNPYKKSPDELGVFATRSQFRPNPILITTVFVEEVDVENGVIYTPYIDAENDTPLLDIKPYHLYERVENCQVPGWCSHWPSSYEKSASFAWEKEFNF